MPISLSVNKLNVKDSNGYSAVGLLYSDVTLDFVTPEMYGAIGDGVSDDTQALQTCINGGGIIHCTKTYKISNTISLKSNITILGFGLGRIIKEYGSNTHYASFSYYGPVVIDNVCIDGLSFVGEKYWTGQSLSGTNNDFGIRLVNAQSIKITNCYFYNFGGCAISVSGNNCNIDSNHIWYTDTFEGNDPNYNFGISFSGESISITHNVINGTIQGLISGTMAKNIIISNNDIKTNDNGQHGIYMEGADSVIVSNNNIHDCSLCGVKFQLGNDIENFQGMVIADNIIVRCASHGILIVDLADTDLNPEACNITGNYIDTTDNGIHLSKCTGGIVTNNLIKNVSSYGIRLASINRIAIQGNNIIALNAHGIAFHDTPAQSVTIRDNNIQLSGTASWYALLIYQGTNIVISGNYLLCDTASNNKYGIGILNDSTSDVVDMIVINNFVKGFNHDYSATNPDGITAQNNYLV